MTPADLATLRVRYTAAIDAGLARRQRVRKLRTVRDLDLVPEGEAPKP